MATRDNVKTQLKRVPQVRHVAATFNSPGNRGHRLGAVARTLRYDVVTRWMKRPSLATVGQASKIISYPGETNSPQAIYCNPPDWPEMLVWQDRLKPGDLFLDIGANIGIYTIFALDLGATVVAVEPNVRNVERIRENLALNHYSADVIHAAVSNRPGTVRITEDLDSYNHLVHDDSGVSVKAVTFDDVLGDRTAAGVKVDVEGAERLVLEGATRALSEHRIRLLQIEWTEKEVQRTMSETREPIARLLRQFGYQLSRPDRRTGRLRVVDGSVTPDRIDVFAEPIA
jgi:FkbM family methyltransferase